MSLELLDRPVRRLEDTMWRRLASAEQTVARIRPLFPLLGITRVADVTGLDRIGIPVVMAIRPNSRTLAVSQGKGVSLAAAQASGVMESVEIWHAERITHPLKFGSFEDLCYSHVLVDPDTLPRASASLYTPFTPMLWIEGRSLARNRSTWVPFECVHANFTLPLPTGSGCFQAGTNGLASGNHPLEAIIHGLCEVIERDALTLWHQQPRQAREETRIDLETIADPVCRDLLARFAKAGVEVGVWDVTSDIGLPTFLCRIVQSNGDHAASIRPATGCGTHLVREIALTRALTEAAQSRLTTISGARDDMLRDGYARHLDPTFQAGWLHEIRHGAAVRDFNDIPRWEGCSLRDDLDEIVDRLAARGLNEVITVDLTKPELAIPVYRVIVPGLEGVDSTADYLLGPRGRAVAGR